jgi:hypothetical protein
VEGFSLPQQEGPPDVVVRALQGIPKISCCRRGEGDRNDAPIPRGGVCARPLARRMLSASSLFKITSIMTSNQKTDT